MLTDKAADTLDLALEKQHDFHISKMASELRLDLCLRVGHRGVILSYHTRAHTNFIYFLPYFACCRVTQGYFDWVSPSLLTKFAIL